MTIIWFVLDPYKTFYFKKCTLFLFGANVVYILQIKDALFIENFYVGLLLACLCSFLTFLVRNKLVRFTIPMCKEMEVSYIQNFF